MEEAQTRISTHSSSGRSLLGVLHRFSQFFQHRSLWQYPVISPGQMSQQWGCDAPWGTDTRFHAHPTTRMLPAGAWGSLAPWLSLASYLFLLFSITAMCGICKQAQCQALHLQTAGWWEGMQPTLQQQQEPMCTHLSLDRLTGTWPKEAWLETPALNNLSNSYCHFHIIPR